MNPPEVPAELARAVYVAHGSHSELARQFNLSPGIVMKIRDGVCQPEATFGLKPGRRPRVRRDSRGMVNPKLSDAELRKRLKIASQLKRDCWPEPFLTHPALDVLLPVGGN